MNTSEAHGRLVKVFSARPAALLSGVMIETDKGGKLLRGLGEGFGAYVLLGILMCNI